jgi:hypothetical protein
MRLTTRLKAAVALLPVCAIGWATPAVAAEGDAITFTLENDTFTGSDNNYTNGFGFSWVSADLEHYDDAGFLSKWGRFWGFLPFVSDEDHATYAAWSVVQEMHTPDDIDDPDPPLDDQPYAGVLYVDSLLYARKGPWVHAWALKLGVVGPASQAEDVQNGFHDLVGSDEAQGWDTQLPDEPVINLGYTPARLLTAGHLGGAAEWRVVGLGNAGLGTYFTGVGLGVYGEVGWNLVDALGGTTLRSGLNAASTVGVGPVKGWSVAFFGGLGGYGVAHYLPLDGTVFRDSRSVDSEPFVGVSSLGISLRHGRFALGLASSFYTDTFETQREDAEDGSLSLSWFF